MARPYSWNHGLFGCCDDVGACLLVTCCPCVAAGKVAEHVGQNCLLCGALCLTPLACCAMGVIRGNLRRKHDIEGSDCRDYVEVFLCPLCALAQEKAQVNDWETKHFSGAEDLLLFAPLQHNAMDSRNVPV